MNNNGTDTRSGRDEIDPQWEENKIRGNPPEVENGGVPEAPPMLEPIFLPTLRDRTLDGLIDPDSTPNSPGEDDMPHGLLSDSEVLRGIATAALSSMDGTSSVAPEIPRTAPERPASESVSEESRNNLFPGERGIAGVSRRRPGQIQRPVSAMGSSPGTSNAGTSNAGARNASQGPAPTIELNNNQADDILEITPAPPMWEDDEVWITPAYFGNRQVVFDPNQAVRPQRRTMRQRIASARQSIRDVARADVEWVRGAMANIGIGSHDPPEPRPIRTTPSQPSSKTARSKGKGTFLKLRGGADAPDPQDSDSETEDSASRHSPQRPTLPRQPQLQHPVLPDTQVSLREPLPVRPPEYIHPSARNAQFQQEGQGSQHGLVPVTVNRDSGSQHGNVLRSTSNLWRGSSSHHDNIPPAASGSGRASSTPHDNAPATASGTGGVSSTQHGNSPVTASGIGNTSGTQHGNIPATASGIGSTSSTQHGNTPATTSGIGSGAYNGPTTGNSQGAQPPDAPISDALLNAPMPNVNKPKSLSTFGKEAGRKIKEKFSTLGRKKQPPQEPAPEPEIAVHEEVYNTTSGTGKFQMWPFGRKKNKENVTTYF